MCGFPSRESSATYAVPALACEASMTLMGPGGRSFGVTLDHVRPPSRVRCTSPVLAPVQITCGETGDNASAWMDPPAAGPATLLPAARALASRLTFFGAARSPLIVRQVSPRSLDAMTCCAAM